MSKTSGDKTRYISPGEYSEAFGLGIETEENKESKHKRAHALALDIRKFEIELYWKRAGYFWTFIAATLAGFMVIQKDGSNKSEYLSIILCCLGLVFSLAWYCANKGSKQWQENWENHVDLLEDSIVGPLYKVVTSRPVIKQRWWTLQGFYLRIKILATGPSPFSVSKINQIVSLFVVGLWIALLIHVLPPFTWGLRYINWKYSVPIGLAAFACILILAWGRTDPENYNGIRATRRSTVIEDQDGYR